MDLEAINVKLNRGYDGEGSAAIFYDLRALITEVKRLEKWRQEAMPLLSMAREVIDDDLENRPARHSLGKLHAKLKGLMDRWEQNSSTVERCSFCNHGATAVCSCQCHGATEGGGRQC